MMKDVLKNIFLFILLLLLSPFALLIIAISDLIGD